MPSLPSKIHREVLAGIPFEKGRLESARQNHDFYQGNFEPYQQRPVSQQGYDSSRYQRNSLIMNRIVHVLTQHLYAKGPARSIPDQDAASEWVAEQYARCGIDATLQEADRLAVVGDVCALQVVGTGDPAAPVRFQPWPAHQFVAWEHPEDPCKVEAVGTIDFFDESRRLRVWTADTLTTYLTKKLDPGQTSGGTAYYLDSEEENYYGVVPFAFVHFNMPSCNFWSGGPGSNLRDLNDYTNYYLTEVGDDIRYAGKPIIKVVGAGEWQMPRPIQPGMVIYPPFGSLTAMGDGVPPSVEYLQSDMAYVAEGWGDLQNLLDHSLETYGVPISSVRMVQTAARSGMSIVAEQLPLILWAMGRQRQFGTFERELARVSLAVGAAELRQLGAPAPGLDPAAADGLSLRWPSLVPDVPLFGQAQDLADAWALECGITSRIQITMRKYNLDRAAAVEHLKQVAADLAEEQAIGLPPPQLTPTPTPNPTKEGSDGDE